MTEHRGLDHKGVERDCIQEIHFCWPVGRDDGGDMTTEVVERTMTSDEARILTDAIKSATEYLWTMLLEAYEKRAWQALGYDSWRAWATAEFEVSQSRAYQMLQQAQVTLALAEASGDSTMVEITRRDAETIAPHIGEAAEDVRELVAEGMEPRAAVDHVVEKYGRMPTAMVSSESPEWYSPAEILALAAGVLGGIIDVDPCSNDAENPNVQALQHFTRANDGLSQEWHGAVYMNPPYGDEIGDWVRKLRAEYEGGRTTAAVALVPARVDTQWWQTVRDYPVCFVEGRLKFVGAENSAPFPSAVLYLGADVARFVELFGGIGNVYQRVEADRIPRDA